ncbi:hypothetical protein SHKM778_58280 [Streptomyces sp. KM77-8]|uniref:Acyl-CoA dehydrogenase/oxidase C-terminal domain-containing protein n=1 Tax=Streptomyces haneummycinicus TaxID=3074435 RepID=A0AAT9HPV4_9ACTN
MSEERAGRAGPGVQRPRTRGKFTGGPPRAGGAALGHDEDSGMPRHYRQAPLLSIWEGSGRVNALDVLRALGRDPATAQALFDELARSRGTDARLDAAVTALEGRLADGSQAGARRLVERMALALQGSSSSGTLRPRSPTPSARSGWAATGDTPSARCPRRPRRTRSSDVRRHPPADLSAGGRARSQERGAAPPDLRRRRSGGDCQWWGADWPVSETMASTKTSRR